MEKKSGDNQEDQKNESESCYECIRKLVAHLEEVAVDENLKKEMNKLSKKLKKTHVLTEIRDHLDELFEEVSFLGAKFFSSISELDLLDQICD